MFARTDRLLLRPAWMDDAEDLLKAISDVAIARNLASVPWPYRAADAEAFIAAQHDSAAPPLLIFRRTAAAPVLVGCIGLSTKETCPRELGYWIARPHWGNGYATEAGQAVVAIARDALRLDRLIAGHFLDNPASGRVLRKLGFKPTGAIRSRHSAARGEMVPCADFELDCLAVCRESAPEGMDKMMAA